MTTALVSFVDFPVTISVAYLHAGDLIKVPTIGLPLTVGAIGGDIGYSALRLVYTEQLAAPLVRAESDRVVLLHGMRTVTRDCDQCGSVLRITYDAARCAIADHALCHGCTR